MARVKINRTRAREYARNWADNNHVKPLAEEILPASRREAPVLTGALRTSLTMSVTHLSLRVTRRVGTRLNYAYLVHGGAKAHRITPRSPNGRLVFFWKKVGRVVSLKQVNHPGFKGVPYLQRPLVAYGTARRFKVIIFPQVR